MQGIGVLLKNGGQRPPMATFSHKGRRDRTCDEIDSTKFILTQFVGWVERSETHRQGAISMMGFTSFNPSYIATSRRLHGVDEARVHEGREVRHALDLFERQHVVGVDFRLFDLL